MPTAHSRKSASTHDTQGRPYAKLSELKIGDILVPDGSFTCIALGEQQIVQKDVHGLFIDCHGDPSWDKHYLLADDGEHLIGLYRREDY